MTDSHLDTCEQARQILQQIYNDRCGAEFSAKIQERLVDLAVHVTDYAQRLYIPIATTENHS